MLVIRLQRTGRKGHAMFRVVVQDSRRSPSSGKVVSFLGSFDPHSKNVSINKEKTQKYLDNGAQPSDRVVSILKGETVKLPSWVTLSTKKQKTVKTPEKRRSTAPEQPVEKAPVEKVPIEAEQSDASETPSPEQEPATETPVEEATPLKTTLEATKETEINAEAPKPEEDKQPETKATTEESK
jgi:small subunit ribosomal protein S16